MKNTIIEQARIITGLAEENQRLMALVKAGASREFHLIEKTGRMGAEIRELRKQLTRRKTAMEKIEDPATGDYASCLKCGREMVQNAATGRDECPNCRYEGAENERDY